MKKQNTLAVAAFLCAAASSFAMPLKVADITVSGYTGSSTLENFPVLVRIAEYDANTGKGIQGFSYADCAAGGADISFVSAGTILAHEIDTWNPEGESLVWVRLPSLSGTATTFTLRWDDANPPSVTASDVWGANYIGVWHFSEEGGNATDATGHGLTGVETGSSSLAPASKVGGARAVASGALQVANYESSYGGATVFSASGWFYCPGVTASYRSVINKKTSAGAAWNSASGWFLEMNNSLTSIGLICSGSTKYTCNIPNITQGWNYFHIVSSGSNVKLYLNGSTSPGINQNHPLQAAGVPLNMMPTVGYADEFRIRGVANSADWTAAEYRTVANADFLTYGIGRSPAEDFQITGFPELIGAPTPAYGFYPGTSAGTSIPVAFPVWTNETETARYLCTGWKLYNGDGEVVDSGTESAFTYVHPTPAAARRLEWQWGIEYKVTASAGSGGTVSPAEQWVAHGATCAIAVTPDAGCTFVKWTGDLPNGVDQFDKSPTFTVTGSFTMTAIFSALPDRFVEYVESTNKTTYINTGIVPNANATRMFVRLAITAQTSTQSGVFGSATVAATSAGTGSANIYYENKKFRLDWTGSKLDSGITPAVGTVYDIACQYNTAFLAGRRFYVGGTAGNQKKNNNTYPLFLFNCNVSGTAYSNGGVLQRLYGCRIWQDGSNLTANLIPCEKNGVAGLYDTVSGTILFPENFPLVASAADNPGVRVNGDAIEAVLSISNDDGNGTLASAGSTWTEAGTAVTVAPSANDGLQPEYTSTHSGLDYARVYAGPSLSFVMQPWPTDVSVGYSASEYLPHVSDLNEYVRAASEGTTLRLGPGVYTIDKAVSLGKGVTLVGAGRDTTIVNQQLGSYGRGIIMTSSSASIRDLTVSGFTNCLTGAGIWMSAGTVDTVRVTAGYNYDYNNQGKGVGIHMEGGVVTNSLIDRNSYQTGYGMLSAAGVYLNSASASSPALLVDSDIVANWRNRTEYHGIGVTLEGSNPSRVLRCRIAGNWAKIDTGDDRGGCGVYINGASKAVVDKCLIASNGVYGVWMSGGTVRNCLIFGHANSSTRESGVFMKGGSLQNNTISANSSPANYPGLRMTAGTAVNNIVYGNTGGAYGLSVSGGTFNTNIVTDLTLVTTSSAIGNSTGNPLMADPSGGDFSIGFDSPAVDNGAPIASVTEDYTGTERPQDGNGDGTAAYDIGAYEYAPSAGGAMEAAIVVADADFRYDGTATASARVAGGSGEYTYEWYLDGALVPDQTTGEFSATALSTGNHTLRLVVSDGEATVTADYAGVITFHPVEVYVSSTGSATFPYDTPETATDAPSDAFAALWLASDTTCTVHVAEGTFTLTSALTISHPCRILGAGRDATVLSGARLPFAYRAITMSDADSVVCDLTVSGCTNNLSGAGIYMSRGWLENVRSSNNKDFGNGGQTSSGTGLYMAGGTATNCVIDGNAQESSWGNSYGAGVCMTAGLLVDSEISGNWRNRSQFYGAGIYMEGGTVRRCHIHGNSNKTGGSGETAGMGVNLNGNDALVENCVIQGNGRQGVYLQKGTLRNCLVTGHGTASSSYAGGVYMTGGKLVNCTVADNVCSTAAYNDLRMTAGTAANTIAIVATVTDGTTNGCLLNADALFKGVGNYHLALRSPAIDIGDNALWTSVADAVDLDGNPRIVPKRTGVVDAGCYEFQPPAATVLFLR